MCLNAFPVQLFVDVLGKTTPLQQYFFNQHGDHEVPWSVSLRHHDGAGGLVPNRHQAISNHHAGLMIRLSYETYTLHDTHVSRSKVIIALQRLREVEWSGIGYFLLAGSFSHCHNT